MHYLKRFSNFCLYQSKNKLVTINKTILKANHPNLFITCKNSTVRVRFAPSPTGFLHLGGLRTALYNYLFCKKNVGKFILRIEDTDQTRIVPKSIEHLIEMLSWMGIEFDEGPHKMGEYGPYTQSERLNLYKEHADLLLQEGKAYKCFCSSERLDLLRKNAIARRETPRYDNKCRHLTLQEVQEKEHKGCNYVIRLKLTPFLEPWNDLVYGPIKYNVADNEGDMVIMKSDGYPTYHFANVVDDHHMNITHVLRGLEWQISTVKHILTYKAFDWPVPAFAHLPLLQNKDGKKLSKRQNDAHVQYYKDNGFYPESLLSLLTHMGSGFDVPATRGMTLPQLVEHFDISLLNTNSTKVDFELLSDFNRCTIHNRLKDSSSTNQLVNQLMNMVSNKFQNEKKEIEKITEEYVKHVINSCKNRISFISDLVKEEYNFLWLRPDVTYVKIEDMQNFIGDFVSCLESMAVRSKMKSGNEKLISTASHNDDIISYADNTTIDEIIQLDTVNSIIQKTLSKHTSISYKNCMKEMRKRLSSQKTGPSVAEMIMMLGSRKAIRRLRQPH